MPPGRPPEDDAIMFRPGRVASRPVSQHGSHSGHTKQVGYRTGDLQAESRDRARGLSGFRDPEGWCLPWERLASAASQHRTLPSPACYWLHTLLSTAVKGQWGKQLLRWPFWVPLYCWVLLVMSVETSWSQGKESASTRWPPPYICEEETPM